MPLASSPALTSPLDSPDRAFQRVPKIKQVTADDLFISTTDGEFTAEEDRQVLTDRDKYESAREWMIGQYGEELAYAFPEPSVIESNLEKLASDLNTLRRQVQHTKFQINSGFRSPRHNALAGGEFNSRHQRGLAADIKIGGGAGWLAGDELVSAVQGAPISFENIFYKGKYGDRVHVSVYGPDEDGSGSSVYYPSDTGAEPVQGGDYHSVPSDPPSEEAGPHRGDFTTESTSQEEWNEMMSDLGVDPGSHEQPELADYPPPVEGEMDIGDLRFGSVKFDEIDKSDLNQPTSINQQNAGSVAQVPMLRTDMNPVLQDNSALPETVVTLSLNASERDDINRKLRPLMAMHRRMPFNVARNPDLSRMMLGIGMTSSTVDRLSKIYPEMSDQEAREMASEIDETNPGNIWVPVTMRALTVQSQPGAADLYQVHLVLRYANHQPYVPRLTFWKNTEHALQWAQYLSLRSQQGTEVVSTDIGGPAGSAQVETPQGNVRTVKPPLVGRTGKDGNQTTSPHESYVYKKFYRGLLQEYQPQSAGGTFEQFEDAAPLGKAGPGLATEDSQDIYEPAYPIKDATRLFETSRPNADIGLRYKLVSAGTSRDARRQRLSRAFGEQINFAERLNNAANLLKESGGLAGMKEIGKMSPFVIGPGRKVGAALFGLRQTSKALQQAIDDASAEFKTNRDQLKSEIQEWYYAPDEEGDIAQQESNLTLTGLGREVVRESGFMHGQGGMVDFGIPSPEYQDLFIPFSDQVRKIQEGVVKKYASLITYTDENLPPEKQEHWQSFLARQRFEYAAARGLVEGPQRSELEEFSGVATGEVSAEELERGFKSYMLSQPFVQALAEQAWLELSNDDGPVKNQLQTLSTSAAEFSSSIYDSIRSSQDAISEAVRGGESRDEEGFLDLERATIEQVQMRVPNRFGDREWDGYENAVSQHIGGGNAEVTLEMTTDDQLLLDQLGEIKRSQEAMSQLRETQDMVPALVTVFGEGNFLRAHGIKRLAYRSHTVTMAENKPGTYQIRLDLIQDESTLARAEKFRKATSRSPQDYRAAPVKTLAAPNRTVLTDELNTYNDLPAPVASVLNETYGGSSVIPDLEKDVLAAEIGGRIASDAAESEEILPKEFYHGLQEDSPDWFSIVERVRPIAVDCEYVLPEDREQSNHYFRCDVTLKNRETGRTSRNVSRFRTLLQNLGRFLDHAGGFVEGSTPIGGEDNAEFRHLVQSVNDALSTKGSTQKGLVLGWIDFAISMLDKARADEADEDPKQNIMNVPRDPGSGEGLGLVPDNVTNRLRKAIDGSLGSAILGAAARPVLRSADQLARSIASSDAARKKYKEWLNVENKEQGKTIEDLHAELEEVRHRVPSAYPGLKMKEVRDPDQGVNLMAPDFPFGPGTGEMTEDQYLEDYQYADSMRRVKTFKMATIGLNAVQPYINAGVEGEEGPKPGLDSVEKIQEQNVDVLKDAFNQAVQDIQDHADAGAEVPFGASGDHFSKMTEEMEELSGFEAGVGPQLTKTDRVNVLRMSRTFRYVTEVVEAARQANRRGVTDIEMDWDKSLDPRIKEEVSNTIDALRNGDTGHFSGVDWASIAQDAQNVKEVQEDPWLMYRRKQIMDLYSADPNTIADQFGWNDRLAEGRRQKLMEQLRESWIDWKGMRQAFPSYQLIVSGPVGSGDWETLDKLYTWTAVQSITIRDLKDNAGTYASVTLSNMRQRIMSQNGSRSPTSFQEREYDTRLKVKPGTNMYVYTGYGPDVAHLVPFAGRVTNMRPGPTTQIELSSYGSTLNAPPNEGRSFYVDGSDGKATIAEAVMETIGRTTGLDGLGASTDIGSPVDPLGRNAQGNPENQYRMSLAASIYRAVGEPGAGMVLGEDTASRQEVSNMLDYVSEVGTQSLKQFLIGDPAVYENVWLSSAQDTANFSDIAFGGAKDLMTEGKGWGWVSRPNRTAWSQLKEQSKLFPDYVVTTRPYNTDVPIEDHTQHDLRETLYFGPRDGSYIHSAAAEKGSGTFSRLENEEIESIIRAERSPGGRPGILSDGPIRRLYRDLFLRTVYLVSARSVEDSGSPLGLNPFDWSGLSEALPNWAMIRGGFDDFFGGSRFDVTASFETLHAQNVGSREIRSIWNAISEVFPSTTDAIRSMLSENQEISSSVDTLTENTFSIKLNRVNIKAALPLGIEFANRKLEAAMRANVDIADRFEVSGGTRQSRFKESQDAVFNAFIEDLRHLAVRGQGAQNLTQKPLLSNPVVARVRERLYEEGYTPGKRFKPLQKHHFANSYEHVAGNQVEATAQNPEFFNRITLSWPQQADERLSAQFAGQGSRMTYQVQAAPTISEDFIRDRTVYYPNLQYDQAEVTRLLSNQIENVEGGEHFGDLIDRMQTLSEEKQDGQDEVRHDPNNPHKYGAERGATRINLALEDVQQEIQRILDQLNENYVRPKFQTVANNYLLDGLREMYDGELVMKGNPRVRTHDVLHLYDDVKQMHGPVEAKAVMHNYDQSGFYTVAKPQMTARLRGAGNAMDISWMNYAGKYSSYLTGWQRFGSGAMSTGRILGFASMYSAFSAFIGGTAARGTLSLGLGRLAARMSVYGGATGPLAIGLTVADVLYTVSTAFAEAGSENARQYIGMITGAMDANPVTMLPLTYKGQSFTAGLTGAVGPASMQTALEEDLNQAAEDGGLGLDVLGQLRKYSNLESQAPTPR